MIDKSKIEWTDFTWNPWYGCHKVSPGCKNCYMFRDSVRYNKDRDPNEVIRGKTTMNKPLKIKEPSMIFTCSWSDFFIEEADEWRSEAWEIIKQTPHHTYQILTKRPERILDHLPPGGLPDNVWLGVSVEDNDYMIRADYLRAREANVRFVSFEPLFDTVLSGMGRLDLGGIHWAIVGCESGPHRRPMKLEWAREILDQCNNQGVAFFMKQMEIDGKVCKDINQFPEDLQIREYPK